MKNKKVILLAHEHLYGGGTKQTFYIAEALVKAGIETVLSQTAKKPGLEMPLNRAVCPLKLIIPHPFAEPSGLYRN